MSNVYMHASTYESIRNAHTYIAKLVLLKHCKSPSFFDETVHIYCRLLRVARQNGSSDKRTSEQVCILSSNPQNTHGNRERSDSQNLSHMVSHILVYMTIINERLKITKARC